MQGDDGDSSRPIADAADGLEKLRDEDVQRETEVVLDVVRGDMENVRRLIEQAKEHLPSSMLTDLDVIEATMEHDVRKLGDEVSAAFAREIDQLEHVRRPAVPTSAGHASTGAAVSAPLSHQVTSAQVIHVSSTDPAHAEIRKEPPPNAIVVVDEGAVYKSDDAGRVILVEATLADSPPGKRNDYAQRTLPGKVDKDDAGHIIASVLGGIGDQLNLTPMGRTVNRSEYKSLEIQWHKAVEQGKTVDLEVALTYDDDGPRPSWFSVTYKIEGQRSETVDIENVPGEDRT